MGVSQIPEEKHEVKHGDTTSGLGKKNEKQGKPSKKYHNMLVHMYVIC